MINSPDPDAVAVYREKIIDEIAHALGRRKDGAARRVMGPLFRLPANRFAGIIARADLEIRATGLSGGCRRIMEEFSLQSAVRGAGHIPTDGPLLLASNHPGAYDSVAIMACLPRKDLKVILSDVGFTRAFAAAREYFIFAPPGTAGRAQALQSAIGHLKGGGTLLIFPHVEVEPDPEISPGAAEALGDWSRSLELMLRRVPGARLQVTIASGILLPCFRYSPLVKIRKSEPKRQKLAEFLQIVAQMIFPRRVRPRIHISFAEPVKGEDLPAESPKAAILGIARRLLEDHLASIKNEQKGGLSDGR